MLQHSLKLYVCLHSMDAGADIMPTGDTCNIKSFIGITAKLEFTLLKM